MSDSRDDCALKCLEDSSQNDLGTEIEALNNCRHPNIVRLFGHFNVERVQPETLSVASCTLNATGRCRVTLYRRAKAHLRAACGPQQEESGLNSAPKRSSQWLRWLLRGRQRRAARPSHGAEHLLRLRRGAPCGLGE